MQIFREKTSNFLYFAYKYAEKYRDAIPNKRQTELLPGLRARLFLSREGTITSVPWRLWLAGKRRGSNNGGAEAWRSWDCSPVRTWEATALAGQVCRRIAFRSVSDRRQVVYGVVRRLRVRVQATR